MDKILDLLKGKLELCVLSKTNNSRSVSVAISSKLNQYYSGRFESINHLNHITSEAGALVISMQNNDFGIEKVITLTESQKHVDPLVLKIVKDFAIRTGTSIEYIVYDKDNNQLFQTNDIKKELSFYKPDLKQLSKTMEFVPEGNLVNLRELNEENIPKILREYAIKGITRNFPNYDSASGYGAAIITRNNNLYFSGQYSSPDNRLGVHAEMGAVLAAVMNGDKEIKYIGIISSKFKESCCAVCGGCRQFLVEHSSRTSTPLTVYSFAKEKDEFKVYNLQDYLPDGFIL